LLKSSNRFGDSFIENLAKKQASSAIRSLKKQGKPPYGESVRIQFNEDFFTHDSNGKEVKDVYSNIEKVTVGSTAIYLYYNAVQATMLPLSIFDSQAQQNEFLSFITKSVRCCIDGVFCPRNL